MLSPYGPTCAQPEPLTYDPEIYWLMPHYFVECPMSLELIENAMAVDYVNANLDHLTREQTTWPRYTTVDSHEDVDWGVRRYRRRIYEQVGFREIKHYRISNRIDTFYIREEGAPVLGLTLRPLHYQGRCVRGTLNKDVLYVFEAN